jgi:hypothetical protein
MAEHLQLLLQITRSIINIWLRKKAASPLAQSPADSAALKALYRRLFLMPSSQLQDVPCSNDHVYEACRLTSLLLVDSVESNRHLRGIARNGSALQEIRLALQKTDLDGLWGPNIGLLYFVVVVFQSAAFGTLEYPFAHVLQARIHFQVTYSHDDWHGALLPMAVLYDLTPQETSGYMRIKDTLHMPLTQHNFLPDIQTNASSASART